MRPAAVAVGAGSTLDDVHRLAAAALIVMLGAGAPAVVAEAQEAPPDSTPEDVEGDVSGGDEPTEPPPPLPLIPVPAGCSAPQMPHVVFVGEVVDRDYRTVRFEVERIRSGRTAPFADGDRIDVRFGLDAQYLDDGGSYLVSAVVDPDLGLLVSRVTDPIEDFGGDDVIGVSEADVSCADYEDPMRTLHTDGTPVEASVVGPFFDARVRLLGAILIPFGVAFGVIFVLATLRLSVTGLFRSVADVGRGR